MTDKQMIGELAKLTKKYKLLKQKSLIQGQKNKELNLQNKALISENITLKAMMCENYEISQDVLALNVKLYRREQQVKTKQCIIKHIKGATK